MANMSSPLPRLPAEILDLILSNIGNRNDLISLAASSRLCASLIIPRHSEYRIIKMSAKRPEVWAHLAQRADLARNIRVLSMIEDTKSYPSVDRYPLVQKPNETLHSRISVSGKDTSKDEWARNVVQALRNMESLQKFVWIQPWASGLWPKNSANYNLVLRTLNESQSLKELKIVDRSRDLGSEEFCNNTPLWNIADLQSIHLDGWFRCQLGNHSHLTSMMARSPNLQSLTISFAIESPSFWACRFPQLRELALFGNTFSRSNSDEQVLRFLQAHPTLEGLTWYPLDSDSQLVPGSLPHVKHLDTNNDFALTILQDDTVPQRLFERISRVFLDSSTLPILEKMSQNAVRELAIGQYDTLQSVHRLAEIFPNLTMLDITKFGTPDRSDSHSSYTLDDYINTLSRFPYLERLSDLALWEGIQGLGDEAKQAAVTKLSKLCPYLKYLGHWDSKSRRVIDIVLIRNIGQTEWEERAQLR